MQGRVENLQQDGRFQLLKMRSRDPRLGRLWSAPAAAHTVPEQHLQQVGVPSGTAGLHHPADTSQQKPHELRVACSVANLRQLYVTRQDLAVLEAVECKLIGKHEVEVYSLPMCHSS